MRMFVLLLALVIGGVAVAHAEPGVTVRYSDELLRVTLNGSYQGTYYQVWRSGELAGQYQPLVSDFTLCTGDCFLTDLDARPGQTFWYRFDLMNTDGSLSSYGPYSVTVPEVPFRLRVSPNPSSGPVSIELSLPGSARRDAALAVRILVRDLQGRLVRRVHDGPLARGTSTFRWDGRAEDGRTAAAGLFFVRVESPHGVTTGRILRVR